MRTILSLTFGILCIALVNSEIMACDDVLGVCLETSSNPPGALVTNVTGNAARKLHRTNDPKRYYLVARRHVITSVNGTRVYTKEDCVDALRNAGSNVLIDVFSLAENRVRTYSTATQSNMGQSIQIARQHSKTSDERIERRRLFWSAVAEGVEGAAESLESYNYEWDSGQYEIEPSNWELHRMNFRHSPYNYRGY